ncbi:unnamed protein product [Cylicocyclus nassatus]|uniref:Major sperm protein n=1 Tax=Cylicocyclus nassatus TaxID=53992 RepID=A0AA36ME89_CYLNA|nr:unnamed protein product [Cylicocyclus nassatus]
MLSLFIDINSSRESSFVQFITVWVVRYCKMSKEPISLYVPLDKSNSQLRRLVFRNNSMTDIVVKLVPTNPNVIELARDRLRLLPSGSLFIEMRVNYANVGTFDYSPPKICGYAMPVYVHTLPRIGKWLNAPGLETEKQLAFEVQIKFNDKMFSARNIIIDLPGMARLVEAIPNAIPLIRERLPIDSADADTTTAVKLNSQEDLVHIGEENEEGNESCWYSLFGSTNNTKKKVENHPIAKPSASSRLSADTSCDTAMERQATSLNVEQEVTPCAGY